MRHVVLVVALGIVLARSTASAQGLPDGPLMFADGRVVMSAEITATASTANANDEGWFNYSSYEHSTLRNLRVAVAVEATVSRRVALVGEVRTDHFDVVQPYALFVRVRPFPTRAFDVHVGRVPPTFGAFPRRLYNVDNPVIGLPLAYQYLTPLRPDALPRHADDLARMRARGWSASFPVGDATAHPGLPLANALRWDTGVQARLERGRVTVLGSVTTGTPSNPRVRDDNGRPQTAGRVELRPHAALVAGASVARGPYVSDALDPHLPAGRTAKQYAQRAVGADVELSHGRWLLRVEAMRSSWDVPVLAAPRLPDALSAWSGFAEGRVRVAPGVDLAARLERLAFGRMQTSDGPRSWDAPVSRGEAAVSWSPRRHFVVKGGLQINTRDGGLVRSSRIGVLQCIAWF